MNESSIINRVGEFVLAFKNVRDVQFSTVPFPLGSHEGIAYLLLVASINQGTSAEHVRDLLRALYDELDNDLLSIHLIPHTKYYRLLEKFYLPSWKIWRKIPEILSSASKFIEITEKYGGFVERGRKQPNALIAAEKISTQIYYMGKNPGGARKKTWMFMRWMVRQSPDIGIWNPPINPAELRVPLDINTGKAFSDLSKIDTFKNRMKRKGIYFEWENPNRMASNAKNVESVTEVARWIFPKDPARVDYSFFCYGRRFSQRKDKHRCWNFVKCKRCSIKELVNCLGNNG